MALKDPSSPSSANPHRDTRSPRHHGHRGNGQHPAPGSPHAHTGGANPAPGHHAAHHNTGKPHRRSGGSNHVAASHSVQDSVDDLRLGLAPPQVIGTPDGGRILCVAEVRGQISLLNKLAAEHNVQAIIHTGDFGFYEAESFERISDRTLRHLVQHSALISDALRTRLLTADVAGSRGGIASANVAIPPATTPCREMRSQMLAHPDSPLLSEFHRLVSGELRLNVPVYTVWGACEDVRVLEKIHVKEYVIPNLHVLSESFAPALEIGGLRLRLFGLGGAVVLHKLFDNGEGAATIAGGQGTMWTTLLQIGELIDTAQKCHDFTETRILVTHASPGREGLMMQLALALRADFTISASLHFRYGISYNEFCVQSDAENLRRKLQQSKTAFNEVWESVRTQLDNELDGGQRILLNNALAVTNRIPHATTATGAAYEEPAWKNTWNWNLPDANFGHLLLDVRDGSIGCETKSKGFNFNHRRAASVQAVVRPVADAQAVPQQQHGTPVSAVRPAPPVETPTSQAAVVPSPAQNTRPLSSQRDARQRPFGENDRQASQRVPTPSAPNSRPTSAPKHQQQQIRPQNGEPSQAATQMPDGSASRPTSSKGRKPREDKRAQRDRQGQSGEQSTGSAKETSTDITQGKADVTPVPVKSQTDGTASSQALAKTDGSAPSTPNADGVPAKSKRGHKNKKSAGSGVSSAGEKTGSESEGKILSKKKSKQDLSADKAVAAAVDKPVQSAAASATKEVEAKPKGNAEATASKDGEDVKIGDKDGVNGSSSNGEKSGSKASRGGSFGRGRGRGGRGNRGGSHSRGGGGGGGSDLRKAPSNPSQNASAPAPA